jgi:hypothetical protein
MMQRRYTIQILLLLTLLSATSFARAQASFDPKGGCLNVVDISHGQKLSEYGDKCKICCSIEHKKKENVYLCAKSRQENV